MCVCVSMFCLRAPCSDVSWGERAHGVMGAPVCGPWGHPTECGESCSASSGEECHKPLCTCFPCLTHPYPWGEGRQAELRREGGCRKSAQSSSTPQRLVGTGSRRGWSAEGNSAQNDYVEGRPREERLGRLISGGSEGAPLQLCTSPTPSMLAADRFLPEDGLCFLLPAFTSKGGAAAGAHRHNDK